MKTKTKTLLTGLISFVMLNASFVPVFANPVIEQETTQNQEFQVNSAENSLILTPATKDTAGAVQVVPLKAYIALKGEASLQGKGIIQMISEPSASSLGNKDFSKDLENSPLTINTEVDLTSDLTSDDYFVILPEGEHLSDEELEQVEGEAWWIPVGGAVGGIALNAYQNVRAGQPWYQNWGSSAAIGATAAWCVTSGGMCQSMTGAWGGTWNSRRSWGW